MKPDAGSSAVSFEEVLRREALHIQAIRRRRSELLGGGAGMFLRPPALGGPPPPDAPDALERTPSAARADLDQPLVGLALSGGGLRTASFGLGLLQGLAQYRLLRRLDYLSSASTGSTLAGFLLTWLRRRGLHEVEEGLAGEGLGGSEAAELRGLRQAVASQLGTGLARGAKNVLVWLRNAFLNLIAVAAVTEGLGTMALGLERLLGYRFCAFLVDSQWVATLLLAGAAGELALLSHRSGQQRPAQRPLHLFWPAVATIVAAALAFNRAFVVRDVGRLLSNGSWFGEPPDWVRCAWLGGSITLLCYVAFRPSNGGLRKLLAHGAAAVVAGASGGYILSVPALFTAALLILSPAHLTRLIDPLSVAGFAGAVLLYLFLTGNWIAPGVRALCARLCRSLFEVATVWFLVILSTSGPRDLNAQALAAVSPIAFAISFVVLVGALGGWRRDAPVLFDLHESLAPFAFVLANAIAAASLFGLLSTLLSPPGLTASAIGLPLVGLFLLWRMSADDLTVHGFFQARLAQAFLAPACVSPRKPGAHPLLAFSNGTSRPDREDGSLGGPLAETFAGADVEPAAARPPEPHGGPGGDLSAGPYPILGAAAELWLGPERTLQKIPFFFAPLFSGLELHPEGEGQPTLAGFRPTAELAGGISMATAIAVSAAPRRRRRPPTPGIARLWTIFDLREGRWLGNPLRDRSWRKSRPRLGAAYALREGPEMPATAASFLRIVGGGACDNLGLYQLVKRRCPLILACDATRARASAFADLAAVIRRCRSELGVEIEIDLGSFGQTAGAAGAHAQIAVVRYPAGEPGLMLYLRPSLTGDEPGDLLQYAATHPAFPAEYAGGTFDEAEFESYRQLGRHVVESLLAPVGSPEQIDALPAAEIFRALRRHLQPGFKESAPPGGQRAEAAPEAPPAELVAAVGSGECVLCAGLGLGAQAGLPTWQGLLQGLLLVAVQKGAVDPATAEGLASALRAGELEAVADELAHQLPREALLEHLRATVASASPSQAHQLLAEMPFLAALNTGFDELLGTAFGSPVLLPGQPRELTAALQAKTFFVANVVGTVAQPSSLLFTGKELHLQLAANLPFKQFLGALFQRYSVLFVGASLAGVRELFEALELTQIPERRHYALVANLEPLEPVRLRFLERSYNLHVLPYRPRFDFSGLPLYLEQLHAAVAERAPQPKRSGELLLQSVTLENIGPFDELRLDLTPSWNLLLGDNGVGKTVVLRAIAAALCGDKVDPATVARLLRTGASAGSILLVVGGRQYRVELKRDLDGAVRMTSASLSPIKFERWLVLGFPALRSIPWQRPTGPSALRPGAPSAADLLPLLSGEPDDRISDLKQWLVNLDYAARAETPPSPSAKLRDAFFEIFQRLTPDMRFKLHGIDARTLEITLDTDSGLVPLEAISQGTGSVMCWVGTLLERLAETGTEGDFEHGTALVLIDEIDAHMHPKWQQVFVAAFREKFKRVQVVATTHSPLLVGSLKPEEIWLVHRAPLRSEILGVVARIEQAPNGSREIVILGAEEDVAEGALPPPREERRVRVRPGIEILVSEGEVVEEREELAKDLRVVAERVGVRQEGLRADQILTGPLFNLETTRDPETRRLMADYTRLAALDQPSAAERDRLAELAAALNVRMATPEEQVTARMAYDLIHDFATERLQQLSPEDRRKVLQEVKVQLTESVTGSWRPE